MVKTKTMKLGEQTISVEEEQFETIREEWNQYETASGVIVRVKLVVHKISRVLDGDGHPAFSEDGDPRIAVKHQVQIVASGGPGANQEEQEEVH